MSEVIRGQDTTIEVFDVNGELVKTINPNGFTRNLDSDEERQQRLGERQETPRQVLHGFSGTSTFEEEDFVLDDLLDLLVAAYRNADVVFTINIVETVYSPKTGLSRTYLYPNAVFKVNKDTAGKNDPTKLSLEWTSEFREEV